ncbi:MAG: LysR family transcriptional regulator [Clostridia bacterium]|nr:LysR family transcriptional regulator [Clostridia bacterium]
MDTQKIKAILSAVEHKSLSKAAEELSYTPSAMSHIADSIDHELGVKILMRTPLGVSLSDEGKELYNYMKALIDAEKALTSAAQALRQSKENRLRIGTFSSISQSILPEIISQFRAVYPNIKISVSVEDSLEDWLSNDLADIIFADELSFGDNTWIPFLEDPFVAVVPVDMFKGKKRVSKEDLYEHAFVSINEKVLDNYFDKSRFASVLDFESVDNVSVLHMIQHGLGVSVLPKLMMTKRISGIKTLELEEPICRTIGFAYKKDAKQTYASKTFIDYMSAREIKK